MKKSVLIILAVIIIFVGGYFGFQAFYNSGNEKIPKEFSSKFVSNVSREEKLTLAQELILKKSEKSMYLMRQIFSDLEKSADVSSKDPRSLTGKYAETWYYSKQDNITLVELADSQTPLYIFPQMNPPTRSVEAIQESMRAE